MHAAQIVINLILDLIDSSLFREILTIEAGHTELNNQKEMYKPVAI
jgi:hypothetical protein